MFKNKSHKLDISFINYLTEDDVNNPRKSFDQIKKEFPQIAKSNLETFRMYLVINHSHLSSDEIDELQKTIAYLQEQDNQKFINAIKYIECQQQKQKQNLNS
jgi:hypothetical protein